MDKVCTYRPHEELPWWYNVTTKTSHQQYYDFRIGCDYFLRKK